MHEDLPGVPLASNTVNNDEVTSYKLQVIINNNNNNNNKANIQINEETIIISQANEKWRIDDWLLPW